jgi:hypothetical protein
MIEILVWDDISEDLARLKISPKRTHHGPGWPGDEDGNSRIPSISVYELTPEEFKIMCDDEDDNWSSFGCWRWAKGSNMSGSQTARYNINGHYMTGWDGVYRQGHKGFWPRKYSHLLEYTCHEIGASVEKNVVALAVDLAKMNGLTLAQLFKKYQGEFKPEVYK